MRKSLVSTTIFPISTTLGEKKAIEMVAKAGFDAYDFSMDSNIVFVDKKDGSVRMADHPLAGKDYIKFVKELKKVGEDNGIFCNQSHAPFPINNKLVYDNLKKSIECTAIVGGKICVVHPDNNKGALENAEFYQSILPFAKEHGVKIATENMWNYDYENKRPCSAACSNHEDFLAHIKAVNDEYLVACLDVGHAELKGLNTSSVDMIKTLGKSLQCLHLHDNDLLTDWHWLPFGAKIEFHKIIKALKKENYSGEFTLEATNYLDRQEDKEQALKKMCEVARKIADEFDSL